ncbi:LapA family protein [Oceaniglobus indicus]|uniref:LapA family protein n=1 Tax=Oceaniglobus indicus TaxID=2047749 RepID=UPI000C19C36E|nr:LapA family protein [Oceaniglobus indicus]
MRYLRYAVLIVLMVILVVVALANREIVTLQLIPADVGAYLGWHRSVSLPLFMVILLSVAFGVLVGFVWEWLREHKYRAEAARKRREAEALKSEVSRMKSPSGRGDDVLALLE